MIFSQDWRKLPPCYYIIKFDIPNLLSTASHIRKINIINDFSTSEFFVKFTMQLKSRFAPNISQIEYVSAFKLESHVPTNYVYFARTLHGLVARLDPVYTDIGQWLIKRKLDMICGTDRRWLCHLNKWIYNVNYRYFNIIIYIFWTIFIFFININRSLLQN